jgi:hypothetical protein
MAAIERTAYPRFRHEPNARELQDLFTPALAEIDFARSLVRSNQHFFAAVLLLKCLQYLGYFPEFYEIPTTVVKRSHLLAAVGAGNARLRSDAYPTEVSDSDSRPLATKTRLQS